MKFTAGLPGLSRYARVEQSWSAALTAPEFQEIAQKLEGFGFDSLDVPEHMALPTEFVPAMGAYWPHALTAMAFLAGATRRIRVNTAVLVLPFYHPVNLAKGITTLDVLTGGRVMLSVGIGMVGAQAEFAAMGVPYSERGRIADEALGLMKRLWREEEPRFEGRYFTVKDVAFAPRPVQQPHPPLWVGGNSRAALRRAVRYGDGWRPWLIGLEDLPEWRRYMEALPEYSDRAAPLELNIPVSTLRVGEDHQPVAEEGGAAELAMSDQELVDVLCRMAEAGVTWTGLPVPRLPSKDAWLDELQRLSENVMAKAR